MAVEIQKVNTAYARLEAAIREGEQAPTAYLGNTKVTQITVGTRAKDQAHRGLIEKRVQDLLALAPVTEACKDYLVSTIMCFYDLGLPVEDCTFLIAEVTRGDYRLFDPSQAEHKEKSLFDAARGADPQGLMKDRLKNWETQINEKYTPKKQGL